LELNHPATKLAAGSARLIPIDPGQRPAAHHFKRRSSFQNRVPREAGKDFAGGVLREFNVEAGDGPFRYRERF